MARQTYDVIVKIDGQTIQVSALLGDPARRGLPTTSIVFHPAPEAATVCQVTVHWKSELPHNTDQEAAVERKVREYCGQLMQEAAYQGPIDCCL